MEQFSGLHGRRAGRGGEMRMRSDTRSAVVADTINDGFPVMHANCYK